MPAVLEILEKFVWQFITLFSEMAPFLLLGALIAAFVPDDFFLFLHEYPLLCMLVVLVLAMPMYTCATGSIPLALALVEKGITPGAALVLLMAGPATSIASMLVVGKAFGKRTLAAYLVSIALGAMFCRKSCKGSRRRDFGRSRCREKRTPRGVA